MGWNVTETLDCGCELIVLGEVPTPRQRSSLRPVAPCVYHLCRKCGAVPLADSEPDRLCPDCWDDWLRADASGTIDWTGRRA